jgi:hypothetical protein
MQIANHPVEKCSALLIIQDAALIRSQHVTPAGTALIAGVDACKGGQGVGKWESRAFIPGGNVK